MQALDAYGTVRADSSSGTPVSLVVPGQAPPPQTTPGHTTPGPTTPTAPHIPFTGFDLVPALAVAALLVAAGGVLTRATRRPVPVRVTPRPDRSTGDPS
jgi:hypothetical protein